MSVALLTAFRNAAQASEPGGSSVTSRLGASEALGSGLGCATGLAERLHAAPVVSTASPSKAAQNDRGMPSA
jgi:hypothetical protein